MAVANVLKALSKKGSLKDLILYGKLRCFIERPAKLKGLDADGTGQFAILDVFAVKCAGEDYFYRDNSGTYELYYSVGSVLIYTNKSELIGEYVKVGGRVLSKGVTVKQQRGFSGKFGTTAFVFTKVDNKWVVLQNKMVKIGETESSLKTASMLDLVIKSQISGDSIELPPEAYTVEQYSACEDFVELTEEAIQSTSVTLSNSSANGRIDVSKINLNLTYHLDGMEMPEFAYAVEDELKEVARLRSEYAKSLFIDMQDTHQRVYKTALDAANKIVDLFKEKILYNVAENIGRSKIKGRYYLEQFMDCVATSTSNDSDGGKSGKMSESAVAEIKEKLLNNPESIYDPSMPEVIYNPISCATVIIGITTGIGYHSLRKNYNTIKRVGSVSNDAWFSTLLSNPYQLVLMGSGISLVEADVLYLSYSKVFMRGEYNPGVQIRRDLLLLAAIEDCCSDKDSMVNKQTLIGYCKDYRYSGQRYLQLRSFPASENVYSVLKFMLDLQETSDSDLQFLISSNFYSTTGVKTLIERGLIDTIEVQADNGRTEERLMLGKDMEKEFLIFSVFQDKGVRLSGLTDDQIDEVIEEYEEKIGFKLEPLQRDGIHLAKFCGAVLSGCAGSGKTTTSDCIKMCFEKYMDDYKLVYCAPTGKASRRLSEVVGGRVKTCHSEFRIGVGSGESYLLKIDKRQIKKKDNDDSRGKIYMIDEAGMLNRDVLYEVARSINDEDLIFFLGDIKQMPPIGVGVPFYTLMQIMPCVELGVNKRAADGSLVNYNTTLLNNMSEGVIEELLFDDSSFICNECSDIDIQRAVVKSFKDWMSGAKDGKPHNEEDIQVISGYATDKYMYSSTCLNPMIQQALRVNDKLLFSQGNRQFYKNDRVIHTKSNIYGMPRFLKTGSNTFEELATLGVINGEMGVLEGLVNSSTIELRRPLEEDNFDPMSLVGYGAYANINEDIMADILETREAYADRIIDMTSYMDGETHFALMRVYDVDLKTDVYIFYPGMGHMRDGVFSLSGSMLEDLDLAYALTCHKMQGSQTPIALIPLGSTCNPDFINRNMLNTMITRSQGCVELLGTIGGIDSPLNQGRQRVSKFRTSSLLQVLCDEGSTE